MRGPEGRALSAVPLLLLFGLLLGAPPATAEVSSLAPKRVSGTVLTFELRPLQTAVIRSAKIRIGRHGRSLPVTRVRRAVAEGVLRVRLQRSLIRGRRGGRLLRWARKRVRLVVTIAGFSVAPPVRNETTPGTDIARPGVAPPVSDGTASGTGPRVYAYYYLWWSQKHWHDKLGSLYPYGVSPLPLPATLDASGCGTVSRYQGNQLTDVPPALYSQDDPGVIEQHVRAAAAAGLAGFLVNWAGTGTADQTTASVSYSTRLDAMFSAVRKVNAEGIPFKILISYESSTVPPVEAVTNDLAYLRRQYGNDGAYDHSYTSRPMFIWTGSRKYTLDAIRTVSERFRDSFFVVGDEKEMTWSDGRAAYLDGNSYYWSSQDPYGNPRSFVQLRSLAAKVRASGPNPDGSRKLWFAPLTPGYDSALLNGGNTCVPRNDGQTMRLLFNGNAGSSPDGWTLISWNEIAEGTYVEPLQRYGARYLQVLREIIGGS